MAFKPFAEWSQSTLQPQALVPLGGPVIQPDFPSFIHTLTPAWFWVWLMLLLLPGRQPLSPASHLPGPVLTLWFIFIMALTPSLTAQFWGFQGLVLFLGYELLEEDQPTTVNIYWVFTTCQIIQAFTIYILYASGCCCYLMRETRCKR